MPGEEAGCRATEALRTLPPIPRSPSRDHGTRQAMHVFLETDRIVLRRLTEADAELLCQLDSDPEVLRHINGGTPTPLEVIRGEILPEWLRFYEKAGGLGYWAALGREDGVFLGWFALRPTGVPDAHEAAVGYRLRRAAWGCGLATEGVRGLLRKGFEEHGLARVFGTTYEENFGSRRVMEKAVMTLVRRFRLDPGEGFKTFVATSEEPWDGDDLEYAIDRDEWERSA